MTEINKYEDAFKKFAPLPETKTVKKIVGKLLDEKASQNFKTDVLKKLYGCVDLTSLTTTDTKESIWKMVTEVNDNEGTRPDVPNVAAICVYPLFANVAKEALTAQNVNIACVSGGFPHAQTFIEVKIAETSMALMQGADEIDIVMNLGFFFEENYDELTEEIDELKASCGDHTLKVILETGALETSENIAKASILALFSGADFLKTSTGKGYLGASPEAAYVMCLCIKKYFEITGKKIGIKLAGGIRKAEDAVKYYTIVKEVLGEEWLNSKLFRIGASSLVKDLEAKF